VQRAAPFDVEFDVAWRPCFKAVGDNIDNLPRTRFPLGEAKWGSGPWARRPTVKSTLGATAFQFKTKAFDRALVRLLVLVGPASTCLTTPGPPPSPSVTKATRVIFKAVSSIYVVLSARLEISACKVVVLPQVSVALYCVRKWPSLWRRAPPMPLTPVAPHPFRLRSSFVGCLGLWLTSALPRIVAQGTARGS
jgi:hypothetical protein